MKIYVLSFNDSGIYCAYSSFEKAKAVLWESYCDEVSQEIRAKFLDEDLTTLENGYITDYGYIEQADLVEE